MKKFSLKLITALTLGLMSSSSFAAEWWYDRNPYTNWRGIYVSFEQPVESVYVHITGVKNGRCLPPNSNVRGMRKMLPTEVADNYNLAVNLGYKGVGVQGGIGGGSSHRTPQYFYKYEFHDPFLSQVNYRISYVRNGQHNILHDWQPVPNHCAYYY